MHILVFHEALWMGPHLDHSLINPNQLRHYGLTVQDNPFSSMEMHIATADNAFILPLYTMGTTLYFDSHTPTDHELQTCQHIHLTSSTLWDPHHIQFPPPSHRVEISATRTNDAAQHDEDERIVSLAPPDLAERLISRVFIDDVWVENVVSDVRVEPTPTDVPLRRTFISDERHTAVSTAELSERWCIGLAQATNTIKVTTQHGVRSAILPLSRRYKAA